jgi:hypothetical protein
MGTEAKRLLLAIAIAAIILTLGVLYGICTWRGCL